MHTVAGESKTPYADGTGTDASIGAMVCGVQYTPSVLLWAHSTCLRIVTRKTRRTEWVSGDCTPIGETTGNRDTSQALNLGVYTDYSYLSDCQMVNATHLVLADRNKLLLADLKKWTITELQHPLSIDPTFIAISRTSNRIYAGRPTEVYVWNGWLGGTQTYSLVAGDASQIEEDKDGPSLEADIRNVHKMSLFFDNTIILSSRTASGVGKLRVIDLKNRVVSTICRNNPSATQSFRSRDGSPDYCKLFYPSMTFFYPDRGALLTGQSDGQIKLTDVSVQFQGT